MRIRTKLLIVFTSILLLFFIFGYYLVQSQMSSFVQDRLGIMLQTNLETAASQLEKEIERYISFTQSISESQIIINGRISTENLKKLLESNSINNRLSPKIAWIGLLDNNAGLLAGLPETNRKDFKNSSVFLLGRERDYCSSIHISDFCGDSVVSTALPVNIGDSDKGVFIIEFSSDEIRNIIRNSFKAGEVYLVNKAGSILTPVKSNPEKELPVKIQNLSLLKNTSQKKELSNPIYQSYKNYAGVEVFGMAEYIHQIDNLLIIEFNKDEAYKPVNNVSSSLFYASVVLFLSFIISITLIANYFTKSITQLTNAVRQLGRGNLDYAIDNTGIDEIGLLTNVFIKMRHKIKDTENRLKVYNKELASQVELRTYEIKERMEESEEQRRDSEKLSEKLEELNTNLMNEIDERKNVQAALEESESRYRIISDLTSDYALAFRVEKDGRLVSLWVTGALERITGYSKEEIKKLGGWENLIHPDDISIPFRQLGVLLSGKISVVEYRIITKDGQERWMRDYGRPFFDESEKRVTIIYGAVQDITKQKAAEAELVNSEKSYRELFDSSTDAIYIQDAEGRFLAVNSGAEQMYGYSKDYFTDKTPEFVSAPGKNDLNKIALHIKKAFEGEPQTFEFWGKRKNGEIFPKEVRLHRGTYFGRQAVIAMAQDITQRKQAEEQLRKLSHAVEQSPLSIIILDLNWNLEYVNKGFCELTGFQPSDVIGKKAAFLRAPQYDVQKYTNMLETIANGATWQGELFSRKKDGQTFWEEVTAGAICDDQGNITHYIGFKVDATDKKAMEEQFRQAMKMEAIGRLAGGIAHDFNNILTVIMGYSELLLSQIDEDSPYYNKLKQIDNAGHRAENVTNQLLAFSRKQILQPKLLEINRLIHEMENMLHRLIGEHIELVTQLDDDDARIKADPGQIEQVIMNLCINARDAMPDGGRLSIQTAKVLIKTTRLNQDSVLEAGAYTRITISDTGAGIDEETLNYIFEPFFTTKEKGRGTGLGLSTVYGIISQSNGHLSVDSKPDQGTTFKILLPLATEEEIADEEQPEDVFELNGKETILVVEDEDSLRGLITNTLENYNYTILSASNGNEAFKLCTKTKLKLDLILTDVVMPEMGGRQFYENVKVFYPDTKVIYMSGYTNDSIVKETVLTPGTEFIQKPFSLIKLVKKIRMTLDKVEDEVS